MKKHEAFFLAGLVGLSGGCDTNKKNNKENSDRQLSELIVKDNNKNHTKVVDLGEINLVKYENNKKDKVAEKFDYYSYFKEHNKTKNEKEEMDRIITSEKIMLWLVKFGGNRKIFKKYFHRVLENEDYRDNVYNTIIEMCNKYNVPYDIAFGVGANESGFVQNKVSGKSAFGVFQVRKILAKEMGFKDGDVKDLKKNVEIAIKYLSTLYEKYKKWDIVLAIYSSGETSFLRKVKNRKGFKNFNQARNYLKENNIDLIELYSKEYLGLGGQHPFQYPFHVFFLSKIGKEILEGNYQKGDLPVLMTEAEINLAFKKYPQLKKRIKRKKGQSFLRYFEKKIAFKTKDNKKSKGVKNLKQRKNHNKLRK